MSPESINLTPERRAELRELLNDHATDPGEWCCDTLPQAAMDALPALLDAADERDRLAAAVERVRALHAPHVCTDAPWPSPDQCLRASVGGSCVRVGMCDDCGRLAPCMTVRYLDGHHA